MVLAAQVITQDVSVVLPLVIVALGAAASIGALAWRVSNSEKRVDELEKRQGTTEKQLAQTDGQLGTAMVLLGRVEKGVEDIQSEIRNALRKSA